MWNTLLQNTGIISLIITIVAIGLLPILCALLWKRYCKEAVSFRSLLFGVAGFLVSTLVVKLGGHILYRVDIIHTYQIIVYSIMAGAVEECSRYVIIRYMMKKDKTKENMVMYGIGHGGIEIFYTTLLSLASLLIITIMWPRGTGSDMLYFLVGLTPGLLANPMLKFIVAAGTGFNIGIGILYMFENMIGIFFQIDFTILIAYGIIKQRKKCLPLAILVHVIMNQMGRTILINNSWIWYSWLCICVVILTIWARRLYKQMVVTS